MRVGLFIPSVAPIATPEFLTAFRNLPGASQYTYKVCHAGTAVCSNNATVVFN